MSSKLVWHSKSTVRSAFRSCFYSYPLVTTANTCYSIVYFANMDARHSQSTSAFADFSQGYLEYEIGWSLTFTVIGASWCSVIEYAQVAARSGKIVPAASPLRSRCCGPSHALAS